MRRLNGHHLLLIYCSPGTCGSVRHDGPCRHLQEDEGAESVGVKWLGSDVA